MNRNIEINPALQHVTEVRLTADIKELAQLLSSGNWIAICAASCEDGYLFSMGRVK